VANGSPLTARQADVLELIAEGKSNQEVGVELGLTAGTVKMHLSRIYKVLNAKSRTDALAKYNRLRSGARRPASEKGS
jgi:DNA-binding CsgD family transcriptional regulator